MSCDVGKATEGLENERFSGSIIFKKTVAMDYITKFLGPVTLEGGFSSLLFIRGGREISPIIVTDDYLCYKESKSPYNFFLI